MNRTVPRPALTTTNHQSSASATPFILDVAISAIDDICSFLMTQISLEYERNWESGNKGFVNAVARHLGNAEIMTKRPLTPQINFYNAEKTKSYRKLVDASVLS